MSGEVVVPLDMVERGIFGMNQIYILRRDWPVYRVELVRIRDAHAAARPHVAQFAQTAIDKHDERYAETTEAQDDAILAPMVGGGLIGHTRRSIIVHEPPDPASLIL